MDNNKIGSKKEVFYILRFHAYCQGLEKLRNQPDVILNSENIPAFPYFSGSSSGSGWFLKNIFSEDRL